MKDQATTTPTPEPKKPEGESFLTKEPEVKPEPEKKDEAKPEAPEKYEDFTLPEGYKFDDKLLQAATATFKKHGLSQAAAQELVDIYAKNGLEAAKAPYDTWANTQKEWNSQISERFGDRADGVRADINKAIDAALPPSLAGNLRKALDFTGAGSNPDVVEALSVLLKPHYEGRPVVGGKPSPEGQKAPGSAPPSIAEAIYPHLRK